MTTSYGLPEAINEVRAARLTVAQITLDAMPPQTQHTVKQAYSLILQAEALLDEAQTASAASRKVLRMATTPP